MKLFKSGLIYDGTGSEPFMGDILVEGDTIVKVATDIEAEDGWEVIDNGGGNLLGIDANAIVKAPNGQKMTLAQLKQTLIKEGMKAGKAADAIKALQQALGISSRKIFNW
jgi:dihydroorotase-like cyclic amidohydrolase